MERDVPYIAFEGAIARFERIVKRQTIALIICVTLIFASNVAWLCYFNQYEMSAESTETVTLDGEDGNANFVKGGGIINNGEDSLRESAQKDDAEKER